MASQVRFSVHAAPSANLLPDGISSLAQAFQQLYNLLIVSLIVCNKYSFHNK